MPDAHILVVGFGSAGKRHAKNFSDLGCSFSVVDPRKDRRDELANEPNYEYGYVDLQSALQSDEVFDGAVVAAPTKFHAAQTIDLLQLDVPVLVEKPLSKTYDEAMEVLEAHKQSNADVVLGYTWRWWEAVREARALIRDGEIGDVYHANFIMGEYLPDWHPWEDYRDFYMASEELGGGALLDDSHWIDLAVWFFGRPSHVFAHVESISSLEIESDDHVELLFRYDSNLRTRIHLDLYRRPHRNGFEFIGENGTLRWSFETNAIEVSNNKHEEWETTRFKSERNDMFVSEAKHFLDVINDRKEPLCTVEDGVDVMSVICAARESQRSKKETAVDKVLK